MIVIDFETSGEIPHLHSILSIGAVDFSNPKNQFYMECRLREGAKIDPVALQINGFRLKEIKSKQKEPLKNILKEFLKWSDGIKEKTLAGNNHHMDFFFLEYSLMLYKMKNPFKYRLVDAHTLAYVNYLQRSLKPPQDKNGSNINSTALFEYCGLEKEPQPHNGLTGAKIEAEALSRLIYGKNLIPEYRRFKIPEYLKR